MAWATSSSLWWIWMRRLRHAVRYLCAFRLLRSSAALFALGLPYRQVSKSYTYLLETSSPINLHPLIQLGVLLVRPDKFYIKWDCILFWHQPYLIWRRTRGIRATGFPTISHLARMPHTSNISLSLIRITCLAKIFVGKVLVSASAINSFEGI